MAEGNQLKRVQPVEVGDDDPFAELTRIMGFDPRVPVRRAAGEQSGATAAQPQQDQPDEPSDFGIDLERELLGELDLDVSDTVASPIEAAPTGGHLAEPIAASGAGPADDFSLDDAFADLAPEEEEPELSAAKAADPQATISAAASTLEDDFPAEAFADLDIAPEGAEADSAEPAHQTAPTDTAGDAQDAFADFSLDEDLPTAPAAGKPGEDQEIDFALDLAMADVDMDFSEGGDAIGEPAPATVAGHPSVQDGESVATSAKAVAAPIDEGWNDMPASSPAMQESSAGLGSWWRAAGGVAAEPGSDGAAGYVSAPAVAAAGNGPADVGPSLEDELAALLAEPVERAPLPGSYESGPFGLGGGDQPKAEEDDLADFEAQMAQWELDDRADDDGDAAVEDRMAGEEPVHDARAHDQDHVAGAFAGQHGYEHGDDGQGYDARSDEEHADDLPPYGMPAYDRTAYDAQTDGEPAYEGQDHQEASEETALYDEHSEELPTYTSEPSESYDADAEPDDLELSDHELAHRELSEWEESGAQAGSAPASWLADRTDASEGHDAESDFDPALFDAAFGAGLEAAEAETGPADAKESESGDEPDAEDPLAELRRLSVQAPSFDRPFRSLATPVAASSAYAATYATGGSYAPSTTMTADSGPARPVDFGGAEVLADAAGFDLDDDRSSDGSSYDPADEVAAFEPVDDDAETAFGGYAAGPSFEDPSARRADDDAPEIETVDVPETAYALEDDLDIPELSFEDDPAPARPFDDLDHELGAAFAGEMAEDGAPPRDGLATANPVAAAGGAGLTAAADPAAYGGGDYQPAARIAPVPLDPTASDPEFAFDDEDSLGPEGFEERHQPPGRRGFMIAAAVGGLAVLGALGAMALSFSGGSTSDVPVVVQADDGPVKVRPENPGGTVVPNQDNKVYQRVAGETTTAAPAQEKLVSAAEEPVELSPEEQPLHLGDTAPAPADGPRVAEPEATSPEVAVADPATTQDSVSEAIAKAEDRVEPTAPAEAASIEAAEVAAVAPRRVRTMIVKPDGTLVPREETAPEPAVAAGPQPGSEASPIAPAGDPQTVLPDAAGAPPTAQSAAKVPAAAEPSAAPQETASVPSAGPLAPSRPADQPLEVVGEVKPDQVAAAAGAAGAWSVQIASQPSEEAAKATYDDLSRRYAGVIGGKGVTIVKADIVGKGTFYRVRVPAGSRNDAIALCERYKSAGGNCFVSK